MGYNLRLATFANVVAEAFCYVVFVCACTQEVLTSRPQRFHRRSDVFGFGVMLWALSNGTKPWPGLPAVEAARQHVDRKRLPQPDSPLSDDGLWGIMQRCWAHRVAERPTLAAVRDSLAARLGELSQLAKLSPPQPPLPSTSVNVPSPVSSPVPEPGEIKQGPAGGDDSADDEVDEAEEDGEYALPQVQQTAVGGEKEQEIDYADWQAGGEEGSGRERAQLAAKDAEIAAKDNQLAAKDAEIAALAAEIEGLRAEMAAAANAGAGD